VKGHHAVVTGVDVDPEVFPFLLLHARIKDVKIASLNRAIEELTSRQLGGVDVLIGADICFWGATVYPFKSSIVRALAQEVKTVVIAEPGRVSLHELTDHFIGNRQGELLSWAVNVPFDIDSKILRVSLPFRNMSANNRSLKFFRSFRSLE
jgi:hypothetical protein